MNKGIYIALSGAVLKNMQMEIISQNLANAASTAYKKDKISFKDYLFPITQESTDGRAMSELSIVKTDFTEGSMIKTGNTLDIAIDGKGFISLEGGFYTRRGDLKKSSDGYLTAFNGFKVLGNAGPIHIPEGTVQINNNGDVFVNGLLIDTIRITDFNSTESLVRAGDSLFKTAEKGFKANAYVRQAHLEASNVDIIREMVSIIETMREFETFQKTIRAFDEASEKINNELGRF